MIHVVISKGVDILAYLRVKRIDDDGHGRSDPGAQFGTYGVEATVRHANGDRALVPWVLGQFPRTRYNALGLLRATLDGAPDRVLEMEEWLKGTTGGDQRGTTPTPMILSSLLSKLTAQIDRGITAEEAYEEIQSWNMSSDEQGKLVGLIIGNNVKDILRKALSD